MTAQNQICSAFGQASENIVRVYYGDLVRASIWNGDHMVMYRHDFCFALVFSQHMLESEVLPIADLAIVPVRSCRAKNHDDGIIHFSHLLKGKELFEKQIPS